MSNNAPVRLYEGLFLLNQESVSSDFAGCIDFIRNVFNRAGAELIVLRKWTETRLAYEIKGQRRGVFLLAYFNVSGVQIANIDRDCELSELVLRNLITRADHIGETELSLAAEGAELSLEAVVRSDDEAEGAPASDDDDHTTSIPVDSAPAGTEEAPVSEDAPAEQDAAPDAAAAETTT